MPSMTFIFYISTFAAKKSYRPGCVCVGLVMCSLVFILFCFQNSIQNCVEIICMVISNHSKMTPSKIAGTSDF